MLRFGDWGLGLRGCGYKIKDGCDNEKLLRGTA